MLVALPAAEEARPGTEEARASSRFPSVIGGETPCLACERTTERKRWRLLLVFAITLFLARLHGSM